jgi:hypothetical protein
MGKPPRLSITPPAPDDAALRLALGAEMRSLPTPPEAAPPVPPRGGPKYTVSLRIDGETRSAIEEVASTVGWSSNRVLATLVERGGRDLTTAMETGGPAAVLDILLGRR